MSGLRQKLVFALSSLLVLLVASSVLSLHLLSRYSGTVDRVFRENYDSIAYGQGMKDAIDQLDDGLRRELLAPQPAPIALADHAMQRFVDNLAQESGNITVPGEREAVATLRASWTNYRAICEDFGQVPVAEREAGYRTRVFPAGQAVKAAAQQIIDLNLQNLLSADGTIRHDAQRIRNLLLALLGGGILLSIIVMVLFTRALLGPLQTLTRSAREIEQGNLDLVVAVPSRDELGQLAEAFNAMAGRLRETRRSERHKIIRAQRTTQLALDSLPDAVATITDDGLVDLANQTAQRLFHLRPGVRLEQLDLPQITACWRQVVERGAAVQPHGYETVIQVFDGGERFFLPHALPISDRDGQPVGVTIVLADITALRRLDELKSNLLAVVAHEVRTPLTSLRMATHLLLDEQVGALTAKQLELALSARDDANRLHTIVEGLLDISRLESGHALLDLHSVAPRILVDEAVALVQAAYRDQGVRLDAELPPDLPLVQADRVRIAHVFANLLGNALKYTPHGGRVLISAKEQPDAVEFRVADTGSGIPAECRARIFERFYRVPGQPAVGAGLGLAIAKEIVQAHGGRLWLTDQGLVDGHQDEIGSTFCFTVPCVVR